MVKPNSLSKKTRKTGKIGDSGSKTGPIPEPDTEKRILAAARKEFIAKGLGGARMQAVAAEAGVNKALLHYYFRTKDNLYRKVLEDTIATVWGAIAADFRAQDPAKGLEPLLRTVVGTYVRVLAANPEFPLFMFRELANASPALAANLPGIASEFKHVPLTLVQALQEEIRAGRIKPVPPIHFFMNLMGMTVSTFLIMPMLQRVGPGFGIHVEFDQAFLDARVQSITDTLLNGIRTQRNP